MSVTGMYFKEHFAQSAFIVYYAYDFISIFPYTYLVE